MNERARRPFWIHQLAEYVIGLVLVAAGMQAPSPTVPVVLGAAVVLNNAIADGPVSAFDIVPRRVHQVLDVVLVVAIALAAVLPMFDIDVGTRTLLVLVAVVLGFVWWYSSFETFKARSSARTAAASDRADNAGRAAGRLVGKGVNAWRSRRRE